jgi:hypothetical protein
MEGEGEGAEDGERDAKQTKKWTPKAFGIGGVLKNGLFALFAQAPFAYIEV